MKDSRRFTCEGTPTGPVMLKCGRLPSVENPQWVLLAKTGRWRGHPAGEMTVTPAHLRAALDYWGRHYKATDTDIPVDYHHQSVFASAGRADRAPAAGWMKEMNLRAGGTELWGKVEWNEPALNSIKSREYRYLSPVIEMNRPDRVTGKRVPMQISSVALTNTPFLTELTALNDRADAGAPAPTLYEVDAMNELLKQMADALGAKPEALATRYSLSVDCSDAAFFRAVDDREEVVEGLKGKVASLEAKAADDQLPKTLANALGMEDDDPDVQDAAAEILRLRFGNNGTFLNSVRAALGMGADTEAEEVLNEVRRLRTDLEDRDAVQMVNDAVAAGKVSPADKTMLLGFAKSNPEGMKRFLNNISAVVEPADADKDVPEDLKRADATITLTAEDRAVARQMGMTEDEMLEAKRAEAGIETEPKED